MIVREAMTGIPGIVACGLVDLDTGGWIEVETKGSHPEEFVQYLASSAASLFEGDAVTTIRSVLETSAPPERSPQAIDEVIMRSGRLLHVFRRIPGSERTLLVIVTFNTTRMGMVRAAVEDLLELPLPETLHGAEVASLF